MRAEGPSGILRRMKPADPSHPYADTRKRSRWWSVFSTLLLCLAFWLLSIGPVFRLVAAYGLPERWLKVYAPLFWVMDKPGGEVLRPAVEWYVHDAWKAPQPLTVPR